MRRIFAWYCVSTWHAAFLGVCVVRDWPWIAPLVVQTALGYGCWLALEDFRRESVDNVTGTWYDVPSDPDSPDPDGRTE